jgi:hypothetical protein
MNKKYFSLFSTIGLSTVILGAITHIIDLNVGIYLFTFGALVMMVTQLLVATQKHTDSSKQRFARISFISSLFLGLASYFMFIDSNSWAVAVLIYALTTFYLSFRNK